MNLTGGPTMHSLLTRLNAVSAFALSVLAAVTVGCYLSTCAKGYDGTVQIEPTDVKVKLMSDYIAGGKRNDLGYLYFDLTADMSPLFDWNVKQLFLYLAAEYTTDNGRSNEVVIWDNIMRRADNRHTIHVRGAHPKYYFWDDGNGLVGHKNVTLRLYWNVIPNAGYLRIVRAGGEKSVKFPDTYSADRM